MPSPNTTTFAAHSLMTSYQVGKLLQVNPSSVNKWIKDGRIPAYRTPGGHRRIKATDLMAFLTTHKMPIPPGLTFAPKARSVLAISDEPKYFEALALPDFGLKGLHVILAQDGLDGIMKALAQSPDVIILGAVRAPLDALDVCRRLRAAETTAQAHIAVVLPPRSGHTEQEAKKAGASWVLQGPLNKETLLAAVAFPA